jgi:hypothetical protein
MPTRIATMILLLLLSAGLAPPANAAGAADEATLEVLVSTIQANRKAFVAVNLKLEDAQAVGFWPVYERYQQDLAGLSQRLVDVIEEYSEGYNTMSDEDAKQLMVRYLAVEQDRVELRRRFLPQFSEVLPGRTLARLYQIENKMDAVVRFELARDIPVLEQ